MSGWAVVVVVVLWLLAVVRCFGMDDSAWGPGLGCALLFIGVMIWQSTVPS